MGGNFCTIRTCSNIVSCKLSCCKCVSTSARRGCDDLLWRGVYLTHNLDLQFPHNFFIQNHCHICFLETLAIYYKYQTNSVWQSSTSAAVCKTNISTFTDLVNRPLHGFRRRRHLGCGGVAARITANVWDIVQLSTLITPQLYNRSWQKRCLLKGIGMEIM